MKYFVNVPVILLSAVLLGGCASGNGSSQVAPAKTNSANNAATHPQTAPAKTERADQAQAHTPPKATSTTTAPQNQSTRKPAWAVQPPVSRESLHQIGFSNFWLSDLGLPASQRITSVSRINGVLYFTEAPTPLLSAVSMANGRVLWRQLVGKYGQPIYAPVFHNGSLYVNSQTRLYKINPKSGQIQRAANLYGMASTTGALSGDLIIYGSFSGLVFAVNLNSFQTQWDYKLPAPIMANPAVSNGSVIVGDSQGLYVLLDAQSGSFLWQRKAFDGIRSAPLFHGDTVFVASKDRSLYAEDVTNGQDKWIYRSPLAFTTSPAIVGKTLYESIPGEKLIALNPNTGDKLWDLSGGGIPIIAKGDQLLVNSHDKLQLVDQASGSVTTKVPTVLPVQSAVPGPEGSVILISQRGVLLRINPLK